jgi:hypothetical protein
MSLSGFDSNIPQYSALQGYGLSVRCVKNGWLLLQSPNGGEIWKVGDIDSSKWTSSNITNAKIEFSTDNGTNWTTIVGSSPASVGYYPWTIPSTTSVNCLVRISNVSNININSISSNIFTISNASLSRSSDSCL